MRRGEVIVGSAWAVVTGAGSGIGRCYALRLADLGYDVVLVGQEKRNLRETQRDISRSYDVEVRCITLDLARLEAAEELHDRIEEAGLKVDVLINNAGIFSFRDVLKMDGQKMERMLLLHTMTTTKLCRLFAADMIRRGARGYILNMSSYSQWMPFPGLAIYGPSKAYLKAFSVAFSKEVEEQGIHVTAICPAGVATDLYGLPSRLQRLGMRVGGLISADHCARRGLNALWRGERCSVPDWWNRLWIPLLVSLPMWLLRPIRRWTMKFQK